MKWQMGIALIIVISFIFPATSHYTSPHNTFFHQKNEDVEEVTFSDSKGKESLSFPFYRWGARDVVIEYKEEVTNNGNDAINITTYLAVPPSMANQEIKDIRYDPEPDEFKKDRWGQEVACYYYNLDAKEKITFSWTVEARVYNIRYILLPSLVKGEIPEDIYNAYTADDEKYKIYHPLIQSIVHEVAGNETNILIKAVKLHDYVIAHLDYALAGGWDDAPTILERGNGSCSEYCFAYIALCRAAGIPARYKGGTYLAKKPPHVDDIFHRMVQIYLPGYGWIPVDMTFDEWIFHHYAFGAHTNKFFAFMFGGGSSEYLNWTYNAWHIIPDGANITTNSSATWYQWSHAFP